MDKKDFHKGIRCTKLTREYTRLHLAQHGWNIADAYNRLSVGKGLLSSIDKEAMELYRKCIIQIRRCGMPAIENKANVPELAAWSRKRLNPWRDKAFGYIDQEIVRLEAGQQPKYLGQLREFTERKVTVKDLDTYYLLKIQEEKDTDIADRLPERYRKCLESWRRYAPDFEIRIWDQNTYHAENCLFYEQAIQRECWAFASDYARADVLRRYGGIYMDLDVELLRPLDDLLYNDAYMSFESPGRIECGSGMGAKAGNLILEEICRDYESRPFIKADGSPDLSTCPVRYTGVIEQHGLVKNGGFQMVEDITIYPFEVLTGKSFDTGLEYETELSYTLHHHNGSWVPGHTKQAMQDRYAEIAHFLQEKAEKGDSTREK